MKVNIIGAGISGLSAGCYLQMNGFETEIFEKQPSPGGLCTSWKKGDYTFDGCIQWLMGSNESNPFYRLWSELIDMSTIRFVTHVSRMEIELKHHTDKYGDKIFHLYTNLEQLNAYLQDIAPEDKNQIRRLISSMRLIQKYEVPPMIESVPQLLSFKEKMKYARHLPLLLFIFRWRNVTNKSFAGRLKNPFLKEAFEQLFDGDDLPLLILTVPLAFNDKKGVGYPVGGSSAFTSKIESKYRSLGGKVRYNSSVKNIIVEQDKARGVILTDGSEVRSDFTVSSADWNFTVFSALQGNYVDKTILALGNLHKLKLYYSVVLVLLGVAKSFKEAPHFLRFPLDYPLESPDGTKYERMECHIYNYDPTLAPEGKTVISFSFYTRNSDFWIDLRRENYPEYLRIKNEFAAQVIDSAEQRIPQIKENIEEKDIATPATFQRYTGNWKGSVQGWFPGKNIMVPSPVKAELPGLKNFYYTGHWTQPGGGLPIAIKSARDAVQMICREAGREFVVK